MLRPLRPAILAAALLAAPPRSPVRPPTRRPSISMRGRWKAGEIELQAMAIASPDDAEAVAGLGMLHRPKRSSASRRGCTGTGWSRAGARSDRC